MNVTCYGSRGSLPSPSRKGFSTIEYGGNTSCYFIEAGPFNIILDAGSGIKTLGDDLMRTGRGVGKRFIHLISHYHWDHIQGLPFFVPYYIGTNKFEIHGHTPAGEEKNGHVISVVERMLAEQQAPPHFPVGHESLPALKTYVGHPRLFSEMTIFRADDAGNLVDAGPEAKHFMKITTIPLNHPDGGLGYRIDYDGHSVAYCTDNEPLRHPNAQINKICKDVDILILDGQYTEEQLMGPTQCFGHGTPRSCVEQAKACNAKNLWIHHHDIPSDDDKLYQMELTAQKYARDMGFYDCLIGLAREGWVYDFKCS